MHSKQVTDREKSARAVAAAAETHATHIAAGFDRELSPYVRPGEALPDTGLLVRLIGRKIAADNAALVAADRAHEQELADDAGPREDRDEAAARVRSVLVDLRAAIESTYGARGLMLLGLGDAVPIDPSVLATAGSSVQKALNDPEIKLPSPRRAGMLIDRAAFALDLAAELPALQEALAKVATEEREKEATQRAKNEAMAKNDATFASGASYLAMSCQMAGLAEIAAKVRPSGRRPGRVEVEDVTEAPVDAPGGGER
jgi:hypothetical protein